MATDWLLIRLDPLDPAVASWMVASAQGQQVLPPQQGSLIQAAPLAAGRRVAVLVSAADVVSLDADLPAGNGPKLLQAVPYVLEEQLADNVDELHFAVGTRRDDGKTPVAVVTRELMTRWQDALRSAGIVPTAMYAESDFVPAPPGQLVLVVEADALLARRPGALPQSLPLDSDGTSIEAALGDPASAASLGMLCYAIAEEWPKHSAAIEKWRNRFASFQVQLLAQSALPLLAKQLPDATAGTSGIEVHPAAVNLLQGPFAAQRSSGGDRAAWRVAAVLAGALIVLWAFGYWLESRRLHAQERDLDAATIALAQSALPAGGSTSRSGKALRLAFEQRLQQVRKSGGDNMLSALAAVAQATSRVPGVHVESFSFSGSDLDLKLVAADAAGLEHVGDALRSTGWQATLTSTSGTADKYSGKLRVQAGSRS